MDPTVLGVLIGGGLTILGNYIQQHFALKRERELWEQKHDAEEQSRDKASEFASRQNMIRVYHDCIWSLTLLDNHPSNDDEKKEELLQLQRDAIEKVSELSLRYTVENAELVEEFEQQFKLFINSPNYYSANLLTITGDMAACDKTLFPNAPKRPRNTVISYRIQIHVDLEFRKQALVDGREIPPSCFCDFELSDLTSSGAVSSVAFVSRHFLPVPVSSLWLSAVDRLNH